jgi:hypothetical protein
MRHDPARCGHVGAASRPNRHRKQIMDRRKLLQWSGAASALGAATALPERAAAAPASSSTSALGLDAAQMGVRPVSPDDHAPSTAPPPQGCRSRCRPASIAWRR